MENCSLRVVVIIPCLNEEKTIAKVVRDFRARLPDADIYVFDNFSTDRTVAEALQAGAVIRTETRRGKGHVVRSMFRDIDADIYVMVDGDDTYPASAVHDLIEPVKRGLADMTVGSRLLAKQSEFQPLNRFGNRAFVCLLNYIFGVHLTDVLSGFRAMDRALVKGLPLFVGGFDVEVELTMKALERGYRILEVPTALRSRPEGSYSKIRITRDGLRMLGTVLALLRDYKPLTVFGTAGFLLLACSTGLGAMVVDEYIRTGLVAHFPSAMLAVGLALLGSLCVSIGLTLHTINRRFQEMEYLILLTRQ